MGFAARKVYFCSHKYKDFYATKTFNPANLFYTFFCLPLFTPKVPTRLIKGLLKSEWPPDAYIEDVQLVQSLFLTLNEKLFETLLSFSLSVLLLTPPLNLNLWSSPKTVLKTRLVYNVFSMSWELNNWWKLLSFLAYSAWCMAWCDIALIVVMCTRSVFWFHFKISPNTNTFIQKWLWVQTWTGHCGAHCCVIVAQLLTVNLWIWG